MDPSWRVARYDPRKQQTGAGLGKHLAETVEIRSPPEEKGSSSRLLLLLERNPTAFRMVRGEGSVDVCKRIFQNTKEGSPCFRASQVHKSVQSSRALRLWGNLGFYSE